MATTEPITISRTQGTDTMPIRYLHVPSRGIIDLDRADGLGLDGFWIARINVPRAAAGAGVGRALMAALLGDADRTGARLWLTPNPYGELDWDALVGWYERCGFVDTGSRLYLREPVSAGAP